MSSIAFTGSVSLDMWKPFGLANELKALHSSLLAYGPGKLFGHRGAETSGDLLNNRFGCGLDIEMASLQLGQKAVGNDYQLSRAFASASCAFR